MKKILGLLMLSVVTLLPMSTKAAVSIAPNCGQQDANGVITCTVAYDITDAEGVESLTLTLTEKGGAEVVDVVDATGSEWTVSSKNEWCMDCYSCFNWCNRRRKFIYILI